MISTMQILIYDTTLRDGTQGEGMQMSVQDKLQMAKVLDELGVHYIEGGWPGSNPRDEAFFAEAKKLSFTTAKLTAFGSTRRSGITCDQDANLQALLSTGVGCLTIFGKSWKLQCTEALRIEPAENLELIFDSVRYLKQRVGEVLFDAEHFFDGYADDPGYALAAIKAAAEAGADYLVLCETNGGVLPYDLAPAVKAARAAVGKPIGIHTHNDSECAVANALAAVREGASMVQGTVNGVGERCGNANLISIIPALQLKMGMQCVTSEQLARLRNVSRTFDEIVNRVPSTQQAYVGLSAFAHKGGVHVDAVKKNSRTYEHIEPALVGNERRILLSDLSGRANVQLKAAELGVDLDQKGSDTMRILSHLKELENRGYQFEGAGASFRLVVDEALRRRPSFYTLKNLEVHVGLGEGHQSHGAQGDTIVRMAIRVGEEVAETEAAGEGPVHAIDRALRSLVDRFYPELSQVRLIDYKVRVVSSADGTGSVVRVLIQSSDGAEVWGTVGVSPNIIHASWEALVDALDYKLVKDGVEPYTPRSRRKTASAGVRARTSEAPKR
jgi:2-isopropylmalate synthase